MQRKKLLLHSCCGPCSTAVIERLVSEGNYDITVFYCNPNIDDRAEYEHRKSEQIRFINEFNEKRASEQASSGGEASDQTGFIPIEYVEGPYDTDGYLKAVQGLESCPEGGERCSVCFRLRLSETVKYAKANGFDCFDTTLTVSPYKNFDVISAIGKSLAESENIEYLCGNYKKKNGYNRSIELSREYGLYRQHFCGCSFSGREQQ